MRVLVVDDDEAIRAAVSELLRDEGYEVECAATGAQALEALQESPELPGVVVLDLMMPEMSGWDFLDVVRKDEQGLIRIDGQHIHIPDIGRLRHYAEEEQ